MNDTQQQPASAPTAPAASAPAKPLVDTTITIEATGPSGNAYYILGAVGKALREAGFADRVKGYYADATAGDYDHLLAVSRTFVNLEIV